MNAFKKIWAFSISLIVSVSMMNVVASAAETTGIPCGATPNQKPISLQEQLIETKNDTSLSSSEKNMRIDKIQHLMAIQNGSSISTMATIPASQTLTVQFHSQSTDYYCGPATAQQTYEYLYFIKNGRYYAPSQSTIASKLGTTTSGTNFQAILDYLNDSNLDCEYAQTWLWSNQNSYDTMVKESIVDLKPVVLYASIPSSITGRSSKTDRTKWLFTTSGHYLNISGYTFTSSSTKYYTVTDPFADRYTGYSSGVYNVNNTVVKAGTKALGC